MLSRRLHLQIFLTIIASLLATIVVISIMFALFRADSSDVDDRIFNITGQLAWMALPPADAPASQQQDAITRLARDFNIDINLYDKDKKRIAVYGSALEPPDPDEDDSGWQRHGQGPAWLLRLPDDRWLSVNLKHGRKRRPLMTILFVLLGIGAAIGLASYPLVRKLTRRLERLKAGVEQMGQGDLSARVKVEGKDEIASVATSFNDAAGKIERLVNSNRLLLANASHELRTPLARVRLGVEMLKQNKDAKRQAALEADIAELDQLIDEILLMSRLDTDASPQLNETIDVLALTAEEASRYDECNLTGKICEIRGNSKLLRRAVRNLIENAIKHGKPPVEITIKQEADLVVIMVQDHGPGIDTDLQEKIFQPFYRAPGKQNVAGYGLGLTLVKQIVEAHHGHVQLLVRPNELFAVEITLPALS